VEEYLNWELNTTRKTAIGTIATHSALTKWCGAAI
jgi:hypothetical protein